MKNFDRKIIIVSLLCGLTIWFIDAFLDYFFFYSGYGTLLDILILDVPGHELYIRLSALGLFVCAGMILSHYITELKQSRSQLENIFNNVIPICITNGEYDIIGTNRSYNEIFGSGQKAAVSIKCYDSRPGPKCRTDECPLVKVFSENRDLYTCETTKIDEKGLERHFIVSATPYRDLDGHVGGIIETFQDITPRKNLEKEKEKLIIELRDALDKVKVLGGFLPICASCKKIRDDKGYWTQIETYIRNHSEADFSQSICPDCAEKHYSKYKK